MEGRRHQRACKRGPTGPTPRLSGYGLLEFRDFGTRERVTIPPANQVFQMKIPEPRKLGHR